MARNDHITKRLEFFVREHPESVSVIRTRHLRSRCGIYSMLIAVFLLFCTGMQPADAGQKALLIGVGEYPHLPAKWRLAGPRKDVQLMNEFLIDQWGFSGSDVRVIQDREADKQKILDAIGNWLPQVTRSGDRVVIYYSGHGSQVDDVNGDEQDGKDETFVPNDYGRNPKCARVTVAAGDLAECARDMVLDDELANALEQLHDRVVILIADSCNSGTVTKGLRVDSLDAKARYFPFPTLSKGIVRDEDPISNDLGVQLTISAALPHQLAWESGGSGIFTKLFVRALTNKRADLSKNGVVTTAELINYVKPITEKWCYEAPECRERKLGFTPNIDPKNETFVLQPLTGDGLQTVTQDDAGAISDILPEFGSDTISIDILPWHRLTEGEGVSIRVDECARRTLDTIRSEFRESIDPPVSPLRRISRRAFLTESPQTLLSPFRTSCMDSPSGPASRWVRAARLQSSPRIRSTWTNCCSGIATTTRLGTSWVLVKSISAHLYDVWTGTMRTEALNGRSATPITKSWPSNARVAGGTGREQGTCLLQVHPGAADAPQSASIIRQ